ncbi:hypothetical protein [Bradyrhizobium cosmicum]|uniref:hypothetical protein n=1 Tax=Bradyrhizobium cosmicum TaxID=1404864 RepID=UPI00116510B7|nr:hypothetical protein [Bradyrhizobium cosmicum]QDP23205.1 hypothetical protein FNV92_13970 [Bradyrhizobium cosmicum]
MVGVQDKDFGALPNSDDLTDSSGDPELDKALGKALVRMAKTFQVNPSFAFFADGQRPNAYASPDSTVAGTAGSVIFGKSLFQDQFKRYSDGGLSVVAIIAHEFGHICQFNLGLQKELRGSEKTVRRIELHADYMSGWYLGLLKRNNPSVSLWACGDTFNRIGDTKFNEEQHHGTPKERVAAAEMGFAFGQNGSTDVKSAIEQGKSYILTI